jgi:hypothetical protein
VRLRSGCGAELRLRIAEDQIEGLAALARSCDDGVAAAEALRALGFHAESLARHVPLVPDPFSFSMHRELEALVAAGRWQDIAERLARWRTMLFRMRGAEPLLALGCMEQWVRGRTGQPMAAALHEDAHRDALCAVIEALSRSRSEQAAVLPAIAAAALGKTYPGVQVDPEVARSAAKHEHSVPMIEALAWASGAPVVPGDDEGSTGASFTSIPMDARVTLAPVDAGTSSVVALALLAPIARGVRDDAPGTRGFALTHFWSAVNAMLRGDRATARAEARAAQQRGVAQEVLANWWPAEARLLEIALALRAGETVPEGAEHQAHWPGAIAIWSGDPVPATPLELRDRERLADQVRRMARADTSSTGPLERIAYAALRRDLALMIRDQKVADAWQDIVDRDVEALADRDRLIGMILIELMSETGDLW